MTPLSRFLEQAEARCAKATPGPWEQFSYRYGAIDNGQRPQVWLPFTQADELFVENARTDLPAALSLLRAFAAVVEEARTLKVETEIDERTCGRVTYGKGIFTDLFNVLTAADAAVAALSEEGKE